MDLPTCPSCGQSVLDEDAEDCPFCGASMSGKPGAKAPAKSSGADSGGKTESKKRKPETSTEKKSESDDPFDVASPASRKAVQLLPKPTKGKLHRIECPMCETAGFQSKKAAGREVRCANKECLVPIFTAPALESEKKLEAASATETDAGDGTPKSLSVGAYIGIAVVAAVVLGGGAFYFTSEPEKEELSALEQLKQRGMGTGETTPTVPTTPDNPGNTTPDEPKEPVVDPVPAGPPVAEMRSTALRLMSYTSLQRDRNQRKPFCRRLTAEAFAIAGDFNGVAEQLTQLDKVGPQLKYYRILPLVQVAWKHLESGNPAKATEAVTEALPLVDELPNFGTLATDTVTELATVLVAMDRDAEAKELLAKRNDAGPLGQYLESRVRSEITGKQSFDQAVSQRPVTGWSAPQWVAVTVSLTARGMSDKALAFAKQAPDQSAIEGCLSGWAEASLLVAGDGGPLSQIDTTIQSLDNTAQSRIQSRCVLVLHGLGKDAETAAPLAKAKQLLGTPGTAYKIDLDGLKQNPQVKLPDASPIQQKVLAAAELAHAEAVLGQTDAAWKSVLLSMDFARTMAPTVTLAGQPFAEIKRKGEAVVTNELKTLKNLITDDEARNAYQNYRNRSRQLLSAAEERFTLQEQVLTEVLEWGFSDRLWNEIQDRSKESTDDGDQEPWFVTNLVKAIYNDFGVKKQVEKTAEVEAAVTKKHLDELKAPRVVALHLAAGHAMGNSPDRAAGVLYSFAQTYNDEADKRWQQETILRLVSRLVDADRQGDALNLVAAIKDVQTRELAYELAGREITARGHLVEVFEYAKTADIIPPEKVALLRGFVGKLPAG